MDFESVREYAIPVDEIRPGFLEGYVSANEFNTGDKFLQPGELGKQFDIEKQSIDFSLIDVVQDQ